MFLRLSVVAGILRLFEKGTKMKTQNLEADVQLTLETWSASQSDSGAIWEQWNDRLKEAKKSWSPEYSQEVYETANARWPKI